MSKIVQKNLEALGVDFSGQPTARTGQQVLPVGKTAHEVQFQAGCKIDAHVTSSRPRSRMIC